ncbi:cytochrome P450 6a8 [Stomoxys calcitrans]|uniref:cytochrome P450 6a8 n=1 Tax=Stomoxys calcitrans TaxID=35570 RepID=UPI0027E22D9B|nr:cytochrome P450 6a8 [Stomoxys calcitrans]
MSELEAALAMYAFIGLCTLVYGWMKSRMLYWRRRGIPYEDPDFLVGNTKGIGTHKHMRQTLREFYRKFKASGPFGGFFFMLQPVAIVLDMDLVENILIKDCHAFDNNNSTANTLMGIGCSLKEKKLRNKFSLVLNSNTIKQILPSAVKVAHECANVLQEILPDSYQVDVNDLVSRYTTDVMGSCVFELECNSLEDPHTEFLAAHKDIFKQFQHSTATHIFRQFFPRLAQSLCRASMPKSLYDFYFGIVQETVEYREIKQIKRHDFMDILIELKNSKDPNERLNMKEITEIVLTFFVAGFEASSTTLCFALYELAGNQKVQNKLRQEIGEILKKHNDDITYECMQEMPYIEQVISETLRKHAVLPYLERRALVDYPTNTAGYDIAKNTTIFIPLDAIHHDPKIYPEPEKFLPERFEPKKLSKRHSMAYLPFGVGPSHCIAMSLAKMQVGLALITLLRDYRFSQCSKTKIPLDIDLSLSIIKPIGEVFLKVEKL